MYLNRYYNSNPDLLWGLSEFFSFLSELEREIMLLDHLMSVYQPQAEMYCGDSPGWPFTYISQIGAAWSESLSAVHKIAHKGATHERLDVLFFN